MKKALSITTSLQEKVEFNKITCNQNKSTVNNRRSTIQHNLVFKSSQEVLSFMEMCFVLFFFNEFWKKKFVFKISLLSQVLSSISFLLFPHNLSEKNCVFFWSFKNQICI